LPIFQHATNSNMKIMKNSLSILLLEFSLISKSSFRPGLEFSKVRKTLLKFLKINLLYKYKLYQQKFKLNLSNSDQISISKSISRKLVPNNFMVCCQRNHFQFSKNKRVKSCQYLCEQTFFKMKYVKFKCRTNLSNENLQAMLLIETTKFDAINQDI